jgi:hypothetical protein
LSHSELIICHGLHCEILREAALLLQDVIKHYTSIWNANGPVDNGHGDIAASKIHNPIGGSAYTIATDLCLRLSGREPVFSLLGQLVSRVMEMPEFLAKRWVRPDSGGREVD